MKNFYTERFVNFSTHTESTVRAPVATIPTVCELTYFRTCVSPGTRPRGRTPTSSSGVDTDPSPRGETLRVEVDGYSHYQHGQQVPTTLPIYSNSSCSHSLVL